MQVIIPLLLLSFFFSFSLSASQFDSGLLQREALVSSDPAAVCNDGSAPMYYKRTNTSSSVWLMYLEGGGFCFDSTSCQQRYEDSSYSISGSFEIVPKSLNLAGILSNDCAVNPHFCSANIFFLHYCSSDFWLGEKEYIEETIAHFQGKKIFEEMIQQLFTKYPTITQATEVVLSGAATGGIGLLGLADWLKQKLSEQLILNDYKFYAIADSGWYLPGLSIVNYTCTLTQCNLEESVQKAYTYQNLEFDESCVDRFMNDWECAFFQDYYVAYEIDTPVFSTFYLQDSVQLWADGINKTSVSLFNTEELDWAKQRADETKSAADKISKHLSRHGFYIIDCLHHVVTTQDGQISLLEVDRMSLNEALEEWFEGDPTKLIEEDCEDTIACNPGCIANSRHQAQTT